MTVEEMDHDEIVLDDGKLTLDRMVRTLYRNKDGFLCTNEKNHKSSIDSRHNAVCLYIYHYSDGLYTLDVLYVYVHAGMKAVTYDDWKQIAHDAVDSINESPGSKTFHGVYGWSTTTIQITPLRTGDMFIKVDSEGARGVRISFNPRRKNRKAQRGA